MRWDDLQHLEALARTGSATAAARELSIAASTVYRRIEALSESIGSPLLVRGAPDVRLTSAGTQLVELARRMKQGLAAVGQSTQARAAHPTGRVSLTTVEGFLPLLIEPLADLSARYPDLEIALHLGDSGPSVRRREVDVALGVMARPPRGLLGRRVLRIGFGVFGTEDAVARDPRRWVVVGPPLEHAPEAAWERKHAHRVAVAVGSRHAFYGLVRRGVGVGLMPRPVAQRYPELQEVEECAESAAQVERSAWTLIHPEMRDDARVRAVVDGLVEHLVDSQ